MPAPFYILYSQITFHHPHPGTKTGKVGYYKYVEDANYRAGKLFEHYLTKRYVDEHDIWGMIAECGGTPFVHTVPYETKSGRIDYTMFVREEILLEDVDDVGHGPSSFTNAGPNNAVREPPRISVQSLLCQPAIRNHALPKVIPTAPTVGNTATQTNLPSAQHPQTPQWLLCQPAFTTAPPSPLPPSNPSNSTPSISEISSSELLDSDLSDLSDFDLAASLASTSEISLSNLLNQSPSAPLTTTLPTNPSACLREICFSCLKFDDQKGRYYSTGCGVCLQPQLPS